VRPGITRTVPDAIIRASQRFSDSEAVVDGDVRLTYAELHGRVRELARGLLARGVRAGDRVAICAPNTHHWILSALAALYCGTTLVPINTRFTAHEVFDVLERSRASVLLIAGPFLGKDRLTELRAVAGETADGTNIAGLPDLHTAVRIPADPDAETPEDGALDWNDLVDLAAEVPIGKATERASTVNSEHISDVLFTSGTTGRSKGALSRHRQALAVARAWAERAELRQSDRYLIINPFFHSFGYKAGILACLVSGAAMVPQAVFDVDRTARLIERERITALPGPPTIYRELLDHPGRADRDLSSLRLAVTGAAAVPVALVERMQQELGLSTVLTAYGLTEAVVATMCRATDPPETVATTSGSAAAGFDVRIADSHGRFAPDGSTGEIVLRGPNVMAGYLDDPAATRKAVDEHGWLHTGDVGRLDENGNLVITDRLKDMYVCGGFNVYPAEIEQVLTRLDGVAEAAVVGVPDGRLGEVGKVCVVPRREHPLSAEDVLDFCRERLANYKVPRHVELWESLPRNSAGKVLKRELRR
jgi:acyl-CoA synthetase (AMP-forming)/AMP-acid ligase II